jgi:Glucose/sorbosone dehydrogenases
VQHNRWLRTVSRPIALLLVASSMALASSMPAHAASIQAKRVAFGLDRPVAFTFTPGGRIFYVEQFTAEIHLFDPSTGVDKLFFTVPRVAGTGERGLLGIALHPSYPAKPSVFVYATRHVAGVLKNQILRITDTSSGGRNMTVIFGSRASIYPYHNGGRILFGPDGMLYAMVGDAHDSSNAQDLTDERGKVLRIKPNGGVPTDNPTTGSRVFSYGNRNSFGFAFDPETGKLWETENGPECNDEINVIAAGANYAWGPSEGCGGTAPDDTNADGPSRQFPVYFYSSPIGITAGAFCEGCGLGAASEGAFFFGDVNNGDLYRATLNAGRDDIAGTPDVVLAPGRVFSMEVGPDGTLYFSGPSAIYKLVYS